MTSILDSVREMHKPYTEVHSRHGGGGEGGVRPLVVMAGVIFVVLLIIYAAGRSAQRGEGFSPAAWPAEGEFTREWAPYTGSIPNGTWGPQPWAEVASPHNRPTMRDWSLGLP